MRVHVKSATKQREMASCSGVSQVFTSCATMNWEFSKDFNYYSCLVDGDYYGNSAISRMAPWKIKLFLKLVNFCQCFRSL